MSTISTVASAAIDTDRARAPRSRFFVWMSIAMALTVFLGFAPRFYLRTLFGGRELSPLVHLHGLLLLGCRHDRRGVGSPADDFIPATLLGGMGVFLLLRVGLMLLRTTDALHALVTTGG